MAIIQTQVSDLSGATENVSTHIISVDGDSYEIDLTADEFKEMMNFIKPYSTAGRRTTQHTTTRRSSTGKRDPEQVRAMKDWLRANGYEVPARGRISKDLEQAYNTQTPAKK